MMTTVIHLVPNRVGLRDQPRDSAGNYRRDLSALRDPLGRPYKVLDLRGETSSKVASFAGRLLAMDEQDFSDWLVRAARDARAQANLRGVLASAVNQAPNKETRRGNKRH